MEYLLEMFTEKELATMKPLKNICPICNKKCGHIFKICETTKMCGQCMDDMYDTYQMNTKTTELFKCICCNEKIFDFMVDQQN